MRTPTLIAAAALPLAAMPPLEPGPGVRWPARVEEPARLRAELDRQQAALVLLVDFPDNVQRFPADEYRRLLFGSGVGTMTTYYREVSYGRLGVGGEVEGWFRAGNEYRYYLGDSFGIFGQYPNNSQGLVTDLVRMVDARVDFASFDIDGDGVVDELMLVHAGPGAEETGDPDDIWSHKWELSDRNLGSPGPVATDDGVTIDVYSVQPARFEDGRLVSIGVFCHEFGHILGLPDLYDVDYSSSGVGRFCLMAAGAWGMGPDSLPGSSPVHPCAWAKYQLGWLEPDPVERGGVDSVAAARIPGSAGEPAVWRVLTNPGGADWSRSGAGSGEYFLLENRHRAGFDYGLPGAGLLVLHVDESRPGNSDESRPLVGILQADGGAGFALPPDDRGNAADLWSDSESGVGSYTTPATVFYDGVQSGVTVRRISPADSVMTADIEIRPLFLGKVYSYPNPVVVQDGGERATIVYEPNDPDRLAGRFPPFTVRVFNIAAEPVRVLDEPGPEVDLGHRAAFWDLRNERGQPVTSGMYFYTIEISEQDIVEENAGVLTVVR